MLGFFIISSGFCAKAAFATNECTREFNFPIFIGIQTFFTHKKIAALEVEEDILLDVAVGRLGCQTKKKSCAENAADAASRFSI